jgi:hypothetical protein
MTLEEALAYPFPSGAPTTPATIGDATAEDWDWLAKQRDREGKAILGAPLPTFMAVQDELVTAIEARSGFELASYVVGEHIKQLKQE